jgi:hypothetical protein
VLGQESPEGPGVAEWVQAPDADADALERIATPITVDLALVHRGRAAWPDSAASLADALGRLDRTVVVDAGRPHGFTRDMVDRSGRSLLVVRPCFLNLRAARALKSTPDGVVLVRERGRALGVADVEAVTGAPVVAQIEWDPAVARCVDAGLVATRVPRRLLRALARAQRHGEATHG